MVPGTRPRFLGQPSFHTFCPVDPLNVLGLVKSHVRMFSSGALTANMLNKSALAPWAAWDLEGSPGHRLSLKSDTLWDRKSLMENVETHLGGTGSGRDLGPSLEAGACRFLLKCCRPVVPFCHPAPCHGATQRLGTVPGSQQELTRCREAGIDALLSRID